MTVIFVMEEKSKRDRAHSPPPTSSDDLEGLSSDCRRDRSYLRRKENALPSKLTGSALTGALVDNTVLSLWRIPWTEEPGGSSGVTELDTTEAT